MTQKKYCSECDHMNISSAKYCSECGFDLSVKSKSAESQDCIECGEENNKDALFCSNCGTKLDKQGRTGQNNSKARRSLSNKQAHKKVQRKNSFSKYPFLFVLGGLILAFILLENNKKEIPAQKYSSLQTASQDFSLNRKVIEVASKFTCSCGSCGDEELESCSCVTAEQEKNFIREEFKRGKSVPQVVLAVKDRFGHLKPEFADKIEAGGVSLDLSTAQQTDLFSQGAASSEAPNIKIASSNDRVEIFSHFECPCGQCGIPELADCDCMHPKGATEVKLFVDDQIDQQQYTVNEIIKMVDNKYGHKIR